MIPFATTAITVTRVPADPTRDGYDTPPDPVTVATGVRAVISGPSAAVNLTGGDRVVYHFGLVCDPVDLRAGDTVTDAAGVAYRVDSANSISAFGLDHVEAKLRIVQGAS